MVFDPVKHIETEHPEFTVERGPLRGALSCVLLKAKRIIASDELDQARFEGSVCHEGVHLDRGDRCGPIDTVLDAKREDSVEREAAMRLVAFERVRAVAQQGATAQEIAAWIGVDEDLVRTRISMFTEQEWDEMDGHVRSREGAA